MKTTLSLLVEAFDVSLEEFDIKDISKIAKKLKKTDDYYIIDKDVLKKYPQSIWQFIVDNQKNLEDFMDDFDIYLQILGN